jgi:hypothetical protein
MAQRYNYRFDLHDKFEKNDIEGINRLLDKINYKKHLYYIPDTVCNCVTIEGDICKDELYQMVEDACIYYSSLVSTIHLLSFIDKPVIIEKGLLQEFVKHYFESITFFEEKEKENRKRMLIGLIEFYCKTFTRKEIKNITTSGSKELFKLVFEKYIFMHYTIKDYDQYTTREMDKEIIFILIDFYVLYYNKNNIINILKGFNGNTGLSFQCGSCNEILNYVTHISEK